MNFGESIVVNRCLSAFLTGIAILLHAAMYAETSRAGSTIYVSKLGDNSDGSSWKSAFHTIQAGVQAVPDERGGHQVLVRPDTYPEANLFASYKGAVGGYNELLGDFDGGLGSGAKGWVVIDSGAPEVMVRTDQASTAGNKAWKLLEEGDPKEEWGLKSIDWWGTFRASPVHSAAIWDRWIFKNLYTQQVPKASAGI
jgi:hypothetical protein